jgi:ribosomal protein S4E
MQINFHDGTNTLSKDKINVGDSAEIDASGKIKKIIQLKDGNKVFVMSGRNIGESGHVKSVESSGITVDLGGRRVSLKKDNLIVI